eukprot:2244515-Pyramimonas_sp.AAC.1
MQHTSSKRRHATQCDANAHRRSVRVKCARDRCSSTPGVPPSPPRVGKGSGGTVARRRPGGPVAHADPPRGLAQGALG